jgi:hypothetical protein
MNQMAMLDMLKERVAQMEGGRRRRVGRPRKRRGGEIDGYEMSAMSAMGSGLVGGALVGGKRRVGRPRKGVIPPQFLARIEALRRKKSRRKRGRGLVGGATAQEIYEDYASRGDPIPDGVFKLLKAGVKPMTKKEIIIKKIQRIEKQIGLKVTSMEALKKYTTVALGQIFDLYEKNRPLLAYPPTKENYDQYDEDRFVDDLEYYPMGGLEERKEREEESPSGE